MKFLLIMFTLCTLVFSSSGSEKLDNLLKNKKYKDAEIFLQNECSKGNLTGCITLGKLYELGTEDVGKQSLKRDYRKAKSSYQVACRGGLESACNSVKEVEKTAMQYSYIKKATKNFEKDGIWEGKGGVTIRKYPSGNIKVLVPYVNNKINGVVYEFWDNKALKSIINMKNGTNNGKAQHFYKMGELIFEAIWKSGVRVSSKSFDIYGNITEEVNYKNGKVISGYKYNTDGSKNKLTSANIHKMNNPGI